MGPAWNYGRSVPDVVGGTTQRDELSPAGQRYRILEFALPAVVNHQAPASLPSAAAPLHASPVPGPFVRPLQSIGAAVAAGPTDKLGLEIGQPLMHSTAS